MEKTKKQGFFKSIKNSIFNFDSYQDFALEEMKRGIFYFLKLAILFSVIIAIVFSVLQVVVTIPNAKNFIASDIPDFSYSYDFPLFTQSIFLVTVRALRKQQRILPMLRIPNRQNLLPPLYHTAFSVQKMPTCEQ